MSFAKILVVIDTRRQGIEIRPRIIDRTTRKSPPLGAANNSGHRADHRGANHFTRSSANGLRHLVGEFSRDRGRRSPGFTASIGESVSKRSNLLQYVVHGLFSFPIRVSPLGCSGSDPRSTRPTYAAGYKFSRLCFTFVVSAERLPPVA